MGRVGLLIKTWGGSPEVTADFDYFCLTVKDSPPEARIEAAPSAGAVPLEVNLSGASSVDPSGGSMTFKWDLGDGATGEGVKVCICGDVLHSRVARSNIWGLTKMGAEVAVCGPRSLLPNAIGEMGVTVSAS